MRLLMTAWNTCTCPHCEEDFTESACPTCGWEYEPPMDYAERMHESAARSREFQRNRDRRLI